MQLLPDLAVLHYTEHMFASYAPFTDHLSPLETAVGYHSLREATTARKTFLRNHFLNASRRLVCERQHLSKNDTDADEMGRKQRGCQFWWS